MVEGWVRSLVDGRWSLVAGDDNWRWERERAPSLCLLLLRGQFGSDFRLSLMAATDLRAKTSPLLARISGLRYSTLPTSVERQSVQYREYLLTVTSTSASPPCWLTLPAPDCVFGRTQATSLRQPQPTTIKCFGARPGSGQIQRQTNRPKPPGGTVQYQLCTVPYRTILYSVPVGQTGGCGPERSSGPGGGLVAIERGCE